MAKAKKEVKEEQLETQLWKAADKLRKNIDAAEYKHIVLGLMFLKYISDARDDPNCLNRDYKFISEYLSLY